VRNRIAIMLLVLVLLVGAAALPADFDAFGLGEPIMKVVDATTGSSTINLDDPLPFRVNVTLTVTSPVANLYAFQVAIKYDMSLLNCTSALMNISNPSFVFYGKSVIPINPLIVVGASSAYVYWGASLIVESMNLPAGQYLLGQVNFTAVASGTSVLDIITVDEVKPEYPDNSFLLDFALHDIPFLCENCQVNVAGPPPAGPIYIRADGSIDPPIAPISTVNNVTYTLTGNITTTNSSGIIVERNNIVIEGSGFTVEGPVVLIEDTRGILVSGKHNVTIRNTDIIGFEYGIYFDSSSGSTAFANNLTSRYGIGLFSSHNNTVSGNNATSNTYWGVGVFSSSNNTVSGNRAIGNDEGIYLADTLGNGVASSGNNVSVNTLTGNDYGIILNSFAFNNTFSGNNATNGDYGIYLYSASGNTLRTNVFMNNTYNFAVSGTAVSDFMNDIDASNTVEGKPVYYWTNVHDVSVPLDAGYVAIVNSTRVNVQNLNLAKNEQGILLAYTTSTMISQNNVTDSTDGIYLYSSSSNAVTGNNITANGDGIRLDYSSNNNVTENNVTNNDYDGIKLFSSSYNHVSRNTAAYNSHGISLTSSSYGIFEGNTIADNVGIYLVSSISNRFYHNNFINNPVLVNSTSANSWDDGYPSGGNYWSDYTGVDADMDGLGDTPYVIDADNQDNYPLMNRWQTSHDVAITEVVTSKTIVSQGYTVSIDVTLMNQGDFTDNFNITVHANNTNIALQTNITLIPRSFTNITFTWNTTGFAKGNYTISANITQVSGETDATDNILTDGWVCVVVPCDLTGRISGVPDGRCDIRDIAYMCTKFLTTPASPKWDPNCDINDDGVVDMRDISIACSNFLKT
jgi:parallel beta-helix repeat protein